MFRRFSYKRLPEIVLLHPKSSVFRVYGKQPQVLFTNLLPLQHHFCFSYGSIDNLLNIVRNRSSSNEIDLEKT